MTKFPFVIGPKSEPRTERIGSEEAGYIEIIRRGYLTVGEQSTVQQAIAADSSSQKLLSLVRRCANSYGIDAEEAYLSVMAVMGAGSEGKYTEEIADTYGAEIDEITSAMTAAQAHQQLVKAFVLLSFRVSDEINFNELTYLHPDLLVALVELYDAEEKKSLERLSYAVADKGKDAVEEASAEGLEQAEKKQSKTAKQA